MFYFIFIKYSWFLYLDQNGRYEMKKAADISTYM